MEAIARKIEDSVCTWRKPKQRSRHTSAQFIHFDIITPRGSIESSQRAHRARANYNHLVRSLDVRH